jgi:uncharacterized membrane protein
MNYLLGIVGLGISSYDTYIAYDQSQQQKKDETRAAMVRACVVGAAIIVAGYYISKARG